MTSKENRLDKQYRLLEEKRLKLKLLIRSIPREKYYQQPSSGGWSVAQAANHIYLSEKLSFTYLQKKLSYPDTIPSFSYKSWVALFLTKLTLRLPYKVKAPESINMWGDQAILSPDELHLKWNTLRPDLIIFLQSNEPAFRSHLAYKHPFAGRMTMYQMMIFLNDHMAHHLRQINRILQKIK